MKRRIVAWLGIGLAAVCLGSAGAQSSGDVFLPLLGKPAITATPTKKPTTTPTPTTKPTTGPTATATSTPTSGSTPTYTGEGTYYDANGDGNCMFGPSPNDLMVAAMNNPQYNTAAWCGAYVAVTGPNGSTVVQIVDRCPECKSGDLDLSPQAFDKIANRIDDRVSIRWHLVSPALSGPVSYHFKDGSNQWWTAVQVRNHRNPVATFQYKASDGTWKTVARTSYNYFVATSGMGSGPFTFRITDIYGNTLTDTVSSLVADATFPGAAQFPAGP